MIRNHSDRYPPLPERPQATRCEEHDERKCHGCSRCPECKSIPGSRHYYAAKVFPCAVCG